MFCSASDPVALEQAACLLRQGGLIAFPTETYYGLGVDPFNVKALERLFRVKQRQPNKPVLVLVAEQAQVTELVAEVPAILQRLMTTFWPGPLTLVFPGQASLPFLLTGGTGNIGIRHSPHPLASRLLSAFGGPITATSANRSGAPPATTAAAIQESLGSEIDLILDGGTTPGGAGSTLVGCDKDQRLYCLRAGQVSFTEIIQEKMDYKEKLEEIYRKANNKQLYAPELNEITLKNINIIAEKCFSQKGVYTVLITLSIYKIFHPKQDIRNHQTQIKGGFSGRTIDTKYITPTLKKLRLPSMAESGWLTRSLEQPYPYTLDYKGKIGDKTVKKAFLELINNIENNNVKPQYIILKLLQEVIAIQEKNKIIIQPLDNPEKLTISKIIKALEKQFTYHYKRFGGSKLPVLALYAIYQIIVNEISRYDNCDLKPLGSHTASDRTSKSAADIELFKKSNLFEAIEVKLDKEIDANILRRAEEKIIKYNPERYYILSCYSVKKDETDQVKKIIEDVKKTHGCQIVINGVLPTIKYYLRLLSDVEIFINSYSILIQKDTELKSCHKKKWNEIVLGLENEL